MRYTLTISMRVIQAANEKVPFQFTFSVMLTIICWQGPDVFGGCLKNRSFFPISHVIGSVTSPLHGAIGQNRAVLQGFFLRALRASARTSGKGESCHFRHRSRQPATLRCVIHIGFVKRRMSFRSFIQSSGRQREFDTGTDKNWHGLDTDLGRMVRPSFITVPGWRLTHAPNRRLTDQSSSRQTPLRGAHLNSDR